MSATLEIASFKTGGLGGVVGEFAEVGVGLGAGELDIAVDTGSSFGWDLPEAKDQPSAGHRWKFTAGLFAASVRLLGSNQPNAVGDGWTELGTWRK
jgi:hypothetical protein